MQNKSYVIGFCIVVIISVSMQFYNKQDSKPKLETTSADTYIPKGHVLIPIELTNIQSISALIEKYGIIDLYSQNLNGGYSKIIERIKILRAPLNPNLYAVLAKDAEASIILNSSGPFFGVIQNKLLPTPTIQTKPLAQASLPKAEKIELVKKLPQARSVQNIKIEYQQLESL